MIICFGWFLNRIQSCSTLNAIVLLGTSDNNGAIQDDANGTPLRDCLCLSGDDRKLKR